MKLVYEIYLPRLGMLSRTVQKYVLAIGAKHCRFPIEWASIFKVAKSLQYNDSTITPGLANMKSRGVLARNGALETAWLQGL